MNMPSELVRSFRSPGRKSFPVMDVFAEPAGPAVAHLAGGKRETALFGM
jgi:hypothetical protein